VPFGRILKVKIKKLCEKKTEEKGVRNNGVVCFLGHFKMAGWEALERKAFFQKGKQGSLKKNVGTEEIKVNRGGALDNEDRKTT